MTRPDDPADLLRDREDEARVGSAELFFDLVFVFAVTQLSHTLIAHQTPLGFAETGLLFVAVWWAWVYTAWATNWLDPDKTPVRLLLFALMAMTLVMAIAIPDAFAGRGALFGLGFAAIQVGRSLFMIRAFAGQPDNRRNFQRITIWSALAGTFWIGGGFGPEPARLPLWTAALLIEFSGPALNFALPGLGRSMPDQWRIDGAHMAERCGLFIIIALGESILLTGATFAETPWATPTIAAFASAFVGTIAMWWIYFNVGAERGSRRFETIEEPGRLARSAYTYLHIPIVGGIVMVAASDEMTLAHPLGHAEPLVALCLVGGPALYLAGNAAFKRVTGGWFPLSHWIGIGLLAGLALLWRSLAPVALSLAASAVLVLVALWETLSLRSDASREPNRDIRAGR